MFVFFFSPSSEAAAAEELVTGAEVLGARVKDELVPVLEAMVEEVDEVIDAGMVWIVVVKTWPP